MGTTFVWSEKYSVNVKLMDEHHKKLFALMDQLHDALARRQGHQIIGTILDELKKYTDYHFFEEEKRMEVAKYDGLAAQEAAHREFAKKIKKYKEKADSGKEAFITIEVMKSLNDWLITHIKHMDKSYSETMNEAGIH